MTLVRQLVEMHGGSVEAHSEGADRGSEFVVRLPVLADSPAPAAGDSGGDRTECSGPRRILIVDDYAAIAESLMRMLEMGGHEVRIAPDGPSALKELTVWQPEIILLDIGLPGMDGYAVAHAIRSRPDAELIVLIALTGYGQEEDHRRSRESGFDLHLTKPVDPTVLFALIGTVRGQVHASLPTGLTLAQIGVS